MTLEEIADELYSLPPEQFTAARDGFAREVRAAGDAGLAAGVRKLRKPTRGAWLVNLLARERAPELGELLALGAALRAAQAGAVRGAPATDLRGLTERRRTAVSELVAAARRLAATQGFEVTATAQTEAMATLEAATADEAIGAAVGAGRLVAGVSYAGFGELPDVATLTALPPRTAAVQPAPAEPAAAAAHRGGRPEPNRAAAARQAALEAAGLADDAQRAYEVAQAALAGAQAAAEQAAVAEAAARAALGAATADRRTAERATKAAEQALQLASGQARAAHRAADAARRAVAKLANGSG